MLRIGECKIRLWVVSDYPAWIGLSGVTVVPANLLRANRNEQLLDARNKVRLSDASQLTIEKCFNACDRDWHFA